MAGSVAISLVSSLASAMLAGAILARDARHPANRLAALLVGGMSFWAGCEVLWNASSDPAQVMFLVRLSALGDCTAERREPRAESPLQPFRRCQATTPAPPRAMVAKANHWKA